MYTWLVESVSLTLHKHGLQVIVFYCLGNQSVVESQCEKSSVLLRMPKLMFKAKHTYIHTHTCICMYMKTTHQESCEILLVGTESSHTQTQWKFIKECPNACANGGKSYVKYHD